MQENKITKNENDDNYLYIERWFFKNYKFNVFNLLYENNWMYFKESEKCITLKNEFGRFLNIPKSICEGNYNGKKSEYFGLYLKEYNEINNIKKLEKQEKENKNE